MTAARRQRGASIWRRDRGLEKGPGGCQRLGIGPVHRAVEAAEADGDALGRVQRDPAPSPRTPDLLAEMLLEVEVHPDSLADLLPAGFQAQFNKEGMRGV